MPITPNSTTLLALQLQFMLLRAQPQTFKATSLPPKTIRNYKKPDYPDLRKMIRQHPKNTKYQRQKR